MSEEELQLIARLGSEFRDALEACHHRLPPISFREFPRGACGDTCELLGRFFAENGSDRWEYVSAWKDDYSHAWLQKQDVVVDITADQFPGVNSTVIVARSSEWHSGFDVRFRWPVGASTGSPEIEHQLNVAYRMICEEIESSKPPSSFAS